VNFNSGGPHRPNEVPRLHVVRGIVASIVLGPIALLGAALVVTAVISMTLTDLNPTRWLSANTADWILGIGAAGDAANYLRMAFGGLLAAAGYWGISWAFKG
jgi:hypothetical protein